ncbi:MAG TPA: hypothetical protein VD929_08580 [Caulobacteraceae bacterium]|nr:hypothetical protein [Caulobacteraceae bacterium]
MFDGHIENPVAIAALLLAALIGAPLAVAALLRRPADARSDRRLFALGAAYLAAVALLVPLNLLNWVQGGPMVLVFGAEGMDTGLVEYATVANFAAIAAFCAALSRRAEGAARPVLMGFAALAVVALGEEISWGQWIFGWSSPEAFAEANLQGETNLHNFLPPWAFEAAYALVGAGLIAVAAGLVLLKPERLPPVIRPAAAHLSRLGLAVPLIVASGALMQHHVFQELSELALTGTVVYALAGLKPFGRAVSAVPA